MGCIQKIGKYRSVSGLFLAAIPRRHYTHIRPEVESISMSSRDWVARPDPPFIRATVS